jgi:hypothetical protein
MEQATAQTRALGMCYRACALLVAAPRRQQDGCKRTRRHRRRTRRLPHHRCLHRLHRHWPRHRSQCWMPLRRRLRCPFRRRHRQHHHRPCGHRVNGSRTKSSADAYARAVAGTNPYGRALETWSSPPAPPTPAPPAPPVTAFPMPPVLDAPPPAPPMPAPPTPLISWPPDV